MPIMGVGRNFDKEVPCVRKVHAKIFRPRPRIADHVHFVPLDTMDMVSGRPPPVCVINSRRMREGYGSRVCLLPH